ncbi:response regulator, partial [bacterium]|nr:response regulator [bacterium]
GTRRTLVLSVSVDITELKHETEERRRLEVEIQKTRHLESLGVMAGGIAHDFNNLLAGIVGNAEMVKEEMPPGSPDYQSLQMITTAAEHASQLTRQLLAYAGEGTFITDTVDLAELLEQTKPALDNALPEGVSLTQTLTYGLPMVQADISQIRQMITHLVVNAGEAYGSDGEGEVGLVNGLRRMTIEDFAVGTFHPDEQKAEGYYHFLEIKDFGTGMDEETLSKVFEPFFSTKFTGRGLGLSAVLGIVRSHGGFLQILSRPKYGTTVTVFLPAKLKQVSSPETAATRTMQPSERTEAPAILIAEDDTTLRKTIKRLLERDGYRVFLAADGIEALQAIERETIDLVVLDMVMPRMNGVEFIQKARRMQKRLHILMSSGYEQQRVLQNTGALDVDGFLQKPYRPSRLLLQIREILGLEKDTPEGIDTQT